MKPEVRPGNVCLDYCINCSPNCKIVWLTPLFSIYVSFVQISFWLTFMFCSPFPVSNSIMCLCLFIWVPFIVWHHVFWVTASERTTRPSRQSKNVAIYFMQMCIAVTTRVEIIQTKATGDVKRVSTEVNNERSGSLISLRACGAILTQRASISR